MPELFNRTTDNASVTAEGIYNIHLQFTKEFSAESDGIFAEDTDYLAWLSGHSTPRADVKDFLDRMSAKYGDTEALTQLKYSYEIYDRLAHDLSRSGDAYTPEAAEDIRRGLISLYGNCGAGGSADAPVNGFSDAIRRFNADTNGEYLADPAVKTMLSMVKRVEKAACALDDLSVKDYNAAVKQRVDAVSVISRAARQFEELKTEMNAQILRVCPDVAPGEIGATIDMLNGEAEKYGKRIEENTAALTGLTSSREELKRRSADKEREIARIETDIRTTELDIAGGDRDLRQAHDIIRDRTVALKCDRQLEEDEIAENERVTRTRVSRQIGILNGQVKEEHREFFLRTRQELMTMEKLAGKSNGLGYLDTDTMKMLLTADGREKLRAEDGKTFADMDNAAYCDLAEKFVRTYDETHPETQKGFFARTFGRNEKHVDGLQALENCVNAAIASRGGKTLGAILKTEFDKLGDIYRGRIDALPQKNLLNNYNEQYAKITAAETENSVRIEQLRQRQAESKSLIERYTARIPQIENKKARDTARLAQLKKDLATARREKELTDKAVLSEGKKAEELVRKIAEDRSLRARCEEKAESMSGALGCVHAAERHRSMYVGLIDDFRQKYPRPLDGFTDGRANRINERLDGFIRRAADNQGSHKNSREYNELIDALIEARAKGSADFAETLPKIDRAATNYIRAKGSRTLSFGSLRQTRLNFAREIEGFTSALEGAFLEKPAEYTANQRRTEEMLRNIDTARSYPEISEMPAPGRAAAAVGNAPQLDGAENGGLRNDASVTGFDAPHI